MNNDVKNKIKPYCIICGFQFKDMSNERYLAIGNICSVCNRRAERIVNGEISKEQADRELFKTRRENKRLKAWQESRIK